MEVILDRDDHSEPLEPNVVTSSKVKRRRTSHGQPSSKKVLQNAMVKILSVIIK